MTDVIKFVTGNTIVVNEAEGAGSFHALLGGSCGSLPNALTYPAQFVHVGGVLCLLESGMAAELPVLQ